MNTHLLVSLSSSQFHLLKSDLEIMIHLRDNFCLNISNLIYDTFVFNIFRYIFTNIGKIII